MKKNFQSKRAFTFIESLVVVSVLGLTLPIIFTTLFIILKQQLKVYRLSEVKRQGDYIVTYLENVIKENAFRIYDPSGQEICDAAMTNSNGTSSTFRDRYDSSFSIDYSEPDLSISYDNPVFPAPTFAFPQGKLNSSKVIIQEFSILCNRLSTYSAPLVSLSFTACYNNSGSCIYERQEEAAVLDYQANIKLRNFPVQ